MSFRLVPLFPFPLLQSATKFGIGTGNTPFQRMTKNGVPVSSSWRLLLIQSKGTSQKAYFPPKVTRLRLRSSFYSKPPCGSAARLNNLQHTLHRLRQDPCKRDVSHVWLQPAEIETAFPFNNRPPSKPGS